ncbi:50S ribosomal protein L6 [Bacteriovorax sp. Seq25_V]|uniref:50S ribosomal protein L6 n=1 Tax=Bacteriovorax sp. Seq25_V TaxID=1201288 RepID=UPI000389E8F4|nr:50S ribosomal protein L6 [Bacteriovorax sp. Seq25_V]EQC46870.1 ribosomal protein L6 [Bacteriovorax sp. Seq25_V]
MSRIGKNPVVVPEKVQVNISNSLVTVKGPKGELTYNHHPKVTVKLEGSEIVVAPVDETKIAKSMWGTARTLVNNMVVGVTEGFTKALEFNGVGYKAAVQGNVLNLSLGYSHPIEYTLPEGISAKVDKNRIEISGSNKELVGFAAAKVRSFRPPEPYKGKGIKYADETIIRKAGKSSGKK